jgi:hypothetical protein
MVTKAHSAPADAGAGTWWPSKYGADDQACALNEITPAKVLEAVGLVRQGRVYDLAHVLHQDIPAFPGARRPAHGSHHWRLSEPDRAGGMSGHA